MGDRVDVTRTEAVTVSVQPAATHSHRRRLRNRLTVSFLFGWDNQFSGTMIQEATGRTTGGAPINLDETTLRRGVRPDRDLQARRRISDHPAHRGGLNFVWSSSDANEEATPVGTVGTDRAVPLTVHFTEYQYWGIEGGQRWFFARTRFTPFVGYLVGLNRHQDIRARSSACLLESHARAGSAGRQVLRKVVGVQPGSDRRRAHRHWSLRVHGRDATAVHRRAVGRGLAGRRRPAGCQQRELPLVVPDSDRRAHPVLSDGLTAFAT